MKFRDIALSPRRVIATAIILRLPSPELASRDPSARPCLYSHRYSPCVRVRATSSVLVK